MRLLGGLFVAAPLMVLTGLAMSPAVTAAFPLLLRLFGGYQSARTIHFFAFVALLLFVFVHVVMVVMSGFRRQIRAMTVGNEMKTDRAHHSPPGDHHGPGRRRRTRRSRVTRSDLPPTYGNLLRMGDTFTYAAHRALLPGQSLVREYSRARHHLVSRHRHHQSRHQRQVGARRRLSAAAGVARSPTGGCRSRAAWPRRGRSRSPN